MKNILAYIFTLVLLPYLAISQSIPPKREFRAVWIATVANIDWPSQKGLSPVVQQEEFKYILDEHQKNGMNAVVVQVRPSADAFYRSKYELWSQWLTGKQGTEPNPPYDPLAFMIEECHARGMEFHAWFNPYRATFDTVAANISAEHITRRNLEWFLTYGGRKMFDPGLPQVREYIVQVILDVVKNYDVDGIHFDDYFYPYPVAGDTLRDEQTFVNHANGFSNKEDWRRNNVNLLIQMVYNSTITAKPYIKFGISPFGVWRNRSEDITGSDTRAGNTSFSHLYADSKAWMQNGWVDYLVPQNYFSMQYPLVSYEKLTSWWTKHGYNRHIYMGQGPYKINKNADSAWFHPSEIPRQIRLNRSYPQIQGSVYFSSKSLMRNPNHILDSLRNDFYKYPALIPAMPWKDSIPPLPPRDLQAKKTPDGVALSWLPSLQATDGDSAYYFVIYRFRKGQYLDTNDPRNILTKSYNNTFTFTDTLIESRTRYTYIITALDRLHNESIPSNQRKIRTKRIRTGIVTGH